MNPKVIAERLGHSKVAFTLQRYQAVTPTMQAQVVEILEARQHRRDQENG